MSSGVFQINNNFEASLCFIRLCSFYKQATSRCSNLISIHTDVETGSADLYSSWNDATTPCKMCTA